MRERDEYMARLVAAALPVAYGQELATNNLATPDELDALAADRAWDMALAFTIEGQRRGEVAVPERRRSEFPDGYFDDEPGDSSEETETPLLQRLPDDLLVAAYLGSIGGDPVLNGDLVSELTRRQAWDKIPPAMPLEEAAPEPPLGGLTGTEAEGRTFTVEPIADGESEAEGEPQPGGPDAPPTTPAADPGPAVDQAKAARRS